MIYHSRWPFTPVYKSIPDFIFDGFQDVPSGDEEKLYIDVQRPNERFWTLSTYRTAAKRFAAGLSLRGFKSGDRLTLFAGNSINTPVVVMRTIMAGGIFNSANPGFTVRELLQQIKDCEPTFLLAAPNCTAKAFEAAETYGLPLDRVFKFDDEQQSQGPTHWSSLLSSDEQTNHFMWTKPETKDTVTRAALLVYSSGTTGLPKGVEISHYQIVSNALQIKSVLCSDASIRKRRALCALPFYHGLGLLYHCIMAPVLRLQVHLMCKYTIDDMLHNISRFAITELLLVPPMVVAIAKHTAVRKGEHDLSSVKKVVVGAAPLGQEITEQFEELWHGRLRVQQGWGMSEAPAICLAWDEQDKAQSASTSVGELVPGLEARLVNDEGRDVASDGRAGELWVRGPNIMNSYWRNVAATKATITDDGWLMTGDIATVDVRGKWYIVDRKKELIKVRGAQVAPAELEALLLEHPQIVDAAVIGIRSADGDEQPRAYVVARNKRMLTALAVADFVQRRTVKQKRLTGGIVFIKSVPKTAAGKILRRTLREWAAEELKQANHTSKL